jgi:hypothetical protein
MLIMLTIHCSNCCQPWPSDLGKEQFVISPPKHFFFYCFFILLQLPKSYLDLDKELTRRAAELKKTDGRPPLLDQNEFDHLIKALNADFDDFDDRQEGNAGFVFCSFLFWFLFY